MDHQPGSFLPNYSHHHHHRQPDSHSQAYTQSTHTAHPPHSPSSPPLRAITVDDRPESSSRSIPVPDYTERTKVEVEMPLIGPSSSMSSSLPIQSPVYYTDVGQSGGMNKQIYYPSETPDPANQHHPHQQQHHSYGPPRDTVVGYGVPPPSAGRSPTTPYGAHQLIPPPQISSAPSSHLSYPYPPAGGPPYYEDDMRARSVSQPYPSYGSPPSKKTRHDEDDKRTRRKEQNRLAQQDLRRRRLEHAQFLEQKVVELTSQLEAQAGRSAMLEDLCQRLQVDNQNLRGAVSALKGEQPASVVSSTQRAAFNVHPVTSSSIPPPSPPASASMQQANGGRPINPFAYDRPQSSHPQPKGQPMSQPPHSYVDRRMSVVSAMDGSIGSSSGVSAYGTHLVPSGNPAVITPASGGQENHHPSSRAIPSAVLGGAYSATFDANRNSSTTPTLTGSASSGYSDSSQGEGTLPSAHRGYVYAH